VHCYPCGRHCVLDPAALPIAGETPVPALAERFRCTRSGSRKTDARPEWPNLAAKSTSPSRRTNGRLQFFNVAGEPGGYSNVAKATSTSFSSPRFAEPLNGVFPPYRCGHLNELLKVLLCQNQLGLAAMLGRGDEEFPLRADFD
jgi:hypothetical protein